MKQLFKKLIPKFIFQIYHFCLAYLAAFYYGFPSNKLIVVGVTGTAGKSTTVNLIAKVLEEAGYRVGLSSTMNFKIGTKEWINKAKMTMLGRFGLQKLLKQMVVAGCQYALIETSSEGIKQFRHLGINYDVAVFTNLTPEHIESHGSFEKYRAAKEKLFARLSKLPKKKINGKIIDKVIVVNLDDKNVEHFLKYKADKKYGFKIMGQELEVERKTVKWGLKVIEAKGLEVGQGYSTFTIRDLLFKIRLLGKFNVYNSLAAICVGLSQNISLKIASNALEKVKKISGRLELIDLGQAFKVIVDYAHTPESLKQVYQILEPLVKNKMIAVLGACGGGRDKAKRPKLGKLAGQFADIIIVTNEDPYDENPMEIIDQVAAGISNQQVNLFKILDRREAIKKAINLAGHGDVIIITGKGSEQWLMGPKGTKIPWDDRKIVKEELTRFSVKE